MTARTRRDASPRKKMVHTTESGPVSAEPAPAKVAQNTGNAPVSAAPPPIAAASGDDRHPMTKALLAANKNFEEPADAAQERGEVQKHGGQGKRDVPKENIPPTAADAGLTRADPNSTDADVVMADVVEVLAEALAARDRAIERLTIMITDVRADNAAMAARLDVLDPPVPLPGFCSIKEAAGACHFSDEAVRQWAASGQVTSTKTGGRVRVELASVLERAGRRG
jgi:hypothetical protein